MQEQQPCAGSHDGPAGGKEWYLQVVDTSNTRHKLCVKVAARAFCLGFANDNPHAHWQLRDENDPNAVIFNFPAPENIQGPGTTPEAGGGAVVQPWQQQTCTSEDGQSSGHVRIDMKAFIEGRVNMAEVTGALQQGKTVDAVGRDGKIKALQVRACTPCPRLRDCRPAGDGGGEWRDA